MNSHSLRAGPLRVNGLLYISFACLCASVLLLLINEGRRIQHSCELETVLSSIYVLGEHGTPSVQSGKHLPEEGLVFISGPLEIESSLEDDDFDIQIRAVKLKRRVQMYQWIERPYEELDPLETLPGLTLDDVMYDQDWRDKIINSSLFTMSHPHMNPRFIPMTSYIIVAPVVKMARLELSASLKQRFKPFTPFTGDSSPPNQSIHLHADLYYICRKDLFHPEVGDLRIQFSFAGLDGEWFSLIAYKNGSTLQPYVLLAPEPSFSNASRDFFILKKGRWNAEEMIFQEFQTSSLNHWRVRLFCLFGMFCGVYFALWWLGFQAYFLPLKLGLAVYQDFFLATLLIAVIFEALIIGVRWLTYDLLTSIAWLSIAALIQLLIWLNFSKPHQK